MSSSGAEITRCELCGRKVRRLTRHHLIPRTTHGKTATKRKFDKSEMRENIAMLCSPCHKTIHAFLDEKLLMASYNTIEALLTHEGIADFVKWVKNKPDSGNIRVSSSLDKRADKKANGRRRRRK